MQKNKATEDISALALLRLIPALIIIGLNIYAVFYSVKSEFEEEPPINIQNEYPLF